MIDIVYIVSLKNDRFELPLAVCTTCVEVAKVIGRSPKTLYNSFYNDKIKICDFGDYRVERVAI